MSGQNPHSSQEPYDEFAFSHADHPVVNDETAVVLEEATVALTLMRSPTALGDGLADLHAMVSILGQLHQWLPIVITGARNQGHTWADIASQLQVTAGTARRRYRATQDTGPTSHTECRRQPDAVLLSNVTTCDTAVFHVERPVEAPETPAPIGLPHEVGTTRLLKMSKKHQAASHM